MKVNILLFADDVVLIASSKKEMQRLLDIVHLYSRKWRFLFNVDKSKAVVFTAKRVHLDTTPLYLGLDRLVEEKSYKYLGVEFKSNLSWVLMRQRVLNKARTRLALVSKGIASGLSPDASLKMWHTLIQPILEYAVETWVLCDGQKLSVFSWNWDA